MLRYNGRKWPESNRKYLILYVSSSSISTIKEEVTRPDRISVKRKWFVLDGCTIFQEEVLNVPFLLVLKSFLSAWCCLLFANTSCAITVSIVNLTLHKGEVLSLFSLSSSLHNVLTCYRNALMFSRCTFLVYETFSTHYCLSGERFL